MTRPLLTLAALAAPVLALAACAAPTAPQSGHSTPSGAPGTVALTVEISTDHGGLAPHGDGDTCTWHAPEYTVRDGAGTVVDVGELPDTEGRVRDDLCVLTVSLPAPPADVYDVEIAATVPGDRTEYTGGDMISRTDAEAGHALQVYVDGPPSRY
ncbi:hypothetical protein SAMN05421803_1512 [Nocardiopsis flavescens]|uniref:Lipoprotein n=1 Tax=Nocardiopsis flavescens TaxID=758803 RepID=A0A1M6WU70_9ACTN|nr:hypothetical protein [Nocardiopsis flavescens]SHK97139.1 hypothetical protein SAMN05421803_1512 [Nocardiopsis flavescens]